MGFSGGGGGGIWGSFMPETVGLSARLAQALPFGRRKHKSTQDRATTMEEFQERLANAAKPPTPPLAPGPVAPGMPTPPDARAESALAATSATAAANKQRRRAAVGAPLTPRAPSSAPVLRTRRARSGY